MAHSSLPVLVEAGVCDPGEVRFLSIARSASLIFGSALAWLTKTTRPASQRPGFNRSEAFAGLVILTLRRRVDQHDASTTLLPRLHRL